MYVRKKAIPDLSEGERVFTQGSQMYLKAVQRETLVLVSDTRSAVEHCSGTVGASVCSQLLNTAGTPGEGCIILKSIMMDKFI